MTMMKKLRAGMFVLAVLLALCACAVTGKPDAPAERQTPEANVSATDEPAETAENVSLTGPWHLDAGTNDLDAFQDAFPAYAELGASMEIRSNGQISWYIGAEGGHGTYQREGGTLTADMVTDADQKPLTLVCQVIMESGEAQLKMEYNGTTVYWTYGDSPEPSPARG